MIQDCCTPAATASSDLAQLFAFGLLMSAGHCLGMCGPLVCAVSMPAEQQGSARWSAFAWASVYHAGRVASYAILGALLGSLGGMLPDRTTTVVWQASLSFLAAAALLWIGLALFDVFPMAKLPFASSISRFLMQKLGRARSGIVARFGLGMANGLLPCGPVYTAAVAALAAASPTRGALAMVVFGAGTVPVLVAFAFGVRWVGQRLRLGFYRVGAALAILMACQLALRGLAALELVPHARFHEVVLW
ncbi:MAG: sulfite exporter TauE/SafE family protein [Planctomycetes bacterium]|nr:sulfite exporter TauE/SafE family protein [Planctomycetota bacterium]